MRTARADGARPQVGRRLTQVLQAEPGGAARADGDRRLVDSRLRALVAVQLVLPRSVGRAAHRCSSLSREPELNAVRTPITAVGLAGLVWVPTGTTGAEAGAAECVRPTGVQRIEFSAQKYPNVRRHFRGAVRRGWPRRLVVNRRGADARRDRLLRDIPTREGSTATSTRQRLDGDAGRGWSVAGTRAVEGRRPQRAQLREPLTRRVARGPARALLQWHAVPLRVRLTATRRRPSPPARSYPATGWRG